VVAPEQRDAIEIAGRRQAWHSVGEGPKLVLVNGYAATGTDWDPELIAGLARSFELICPDNRGVGDSDLGDGSELTIAGMAGDLNALLDALDVDRAPVVGWSMGGFVAQRLAVDLPSRVEALVLLSTDPGGPAAVRADPHIWARLTDHAGSPREQAARLISVLFPPDAATEIDRAFGDVVADARARLSLRALRAQEAAMEAWHATDQPAAPSGVRALVACGDEDVVIPPANSELLAARWPGSRVERFAGGGHGFMAQAPARLAAAIESFLRE